MQWAGSCRCGPWQGCRLHLVASSLTPRRTWKCFVVITHWLRGDPAGKPQIARWEMLKAKWIGDEWCRMIGLATLLCGLIARLLAPIHFARQCYWNAFLQTISYSDTSACTPCLKMTADSPLLDNLFHMTGQQVRNKHCIDGMSGHAPKVSKVDNTLGFGGKSNLTSPLILFWPTSFKSLFLGIMWNTL